MERDYVEIGGVKWATMNVGAEKETDFGLYFQYCAKQGYPCPTNLYKFDKEPIEFCDSVQAYWGDNWRMPTREEFNVLRNSTTTEWVKNYKDSGVNGMLFTDRNDSSKRLFFPACGLCLDGSVDAVGYGGFYWSSSLNGYSVNYAWYMYFIDGSVHMGNYYRYFGYSVRGVLTDK